MLNKILKTNLFFMLFIVVSLVLLIPGDILLAKQLSISKSKMTISVGTKTSIKVNTKREIEWTTSNSRVLSINNMGKIIAKKVGVANVRAKVGSKIMTCVVTVDSPKLEFNNLKLLVGESTVMNITGTKRPVDWESNNEEIATVEKGEIFALNPGTTFIIATVGRDAECICKITVMQKEVIFIEAMYFKEDNIVLDTKLQTKRLILEVLPSEANELEKIKWTSSNPSIISIDHLGTVKALAQGSVTISATIGEVRASCIINSNLDKEVRAIYLNKTELTFSSLDDQYMFYPTIEPANIQNPVLTWRSDNENIAVVYNGIIRPRGAGICIVTATSSNGIVASCLVKVELQYNEIYLDRQSISFNHIGKIEKITYKFSIPDSKESIIWMSDNPQVAVVDNGVIQSTGNGTTVIRAVLSNGKFSLCIVKVDEKGK